MRAEMVLGDFLVAYLKRAGVTHIFGLPGDLVLRLFYKFGLDRDLRILTCSHEPSVGFAADGYARSTRRLGVVCVTYGAGGHNIVNPIAGAYAEQVPLLLVSGGPGDAERAIGGIHHQAKYVEGQHRIFSEVTCAAHLVHDPRLAAEQVHEVVRTVLSESRPGYLEIHRDMVDVRIPVPESIRTWTGSFRRPTSVRRKLREAVADTLARLQRAKAPVVLAGVELYRQEAERDLLRLAERLRVPVLTTMLAKGVFPMDHPLHMGIHIGPFSNPKIAARVRRADLTLALGTQHTDMNLGGSRSELPPERTVWASGQRVSISHHQYTEVVLRDFVRALVKRRLPRFRERVRHHDNLKRPGPADAPLSVNDLLHELNAFLARHPGHHVFAESGDMLFGGLEIRVPHPGRYFAQGYYASMGFGVPAAMGTEIGTRRRCVVVAGDGAFQMTGPEISHAPRWGVAPIVVVVNNGGWGIFRPVTPKQSLLDIPPWPYAKLAEAWGGTGFAAQSRGELRRALDAAQRTAGFVVVECHVPPDDRSPISERYIVKSTGGRRVA
jgi:indolepyruvate decarboxylase